MMGNGVSIFKITNTCNFGIFKIEKEILTDPRRNTFFTKTRFTTLKGDKKDYGLFEQPFPFEPQGNPQHLNVPDSDFFQVFNKMAMLKLAVEFEGIIKFLKPAGSFLLKGILLLAFFGTRKLMEEDKKELLTRLIFLKVNLLRKAIFLAFIIWPKRL